MSSNQFTSTGPGKTLAYIRADIRKASKSMFLIGPWLDDYVAREIVLVAPQHLEARVLVRDEAQVECEVWARIESALSIFANHWDRFEARTLDRLHAKCLLLDQRIAYVGSANWYRYSLEQSLEIVLCGPMNAVDGLKQECDELWDRARPYSASTKTTSATSTGITHEVLDPLAAKTLKENPKAFVLGRKKKRLK